MCGITGGLSLERFADLRAALPAMTRAIEHRGPDADGHWYDGDAGVALGHRRLSVLDLSPHGAQPMLSASGRFVISYNGEVYNHLELRAKLEDQGNAPAWHGHSDTETLLACVDAWGLERTLRESVGMFAIALWDRAERMLHLARDRFGEKPLYYGMQAGNFLFGSELKALEAHPDFERRIDRDAVALLLRHNYIPAPFSIWAGVRKLMPGTWISVRVGQPPAEPVAYWSLAAVALDSGADSRAMNDDEARDALEDCLMRAVGGQMLSDVPLGALLSGGIDSSMIVALMQAQSTRPVRTFSIGFHDKGFDESVHAESVARHVGTDHTTLHMSPADVLDMVPRVPQMYDEPFADSSQLPTSLVMALARRHVTVALSGDGGDELFGGYNRYFTVPQLWSVIGKVPHPIRSLFSKTVLGVSANRWNALLGPLGRAIGQARPGDKLHKVGQRLKGARTIDDLYLALVTEWADAEELVPGSQRQRSLLGRSGEWPDPGDPVQRMMLLDGLTYLPDDILVKVDRAAMAVSLETRAPFLDHRVAEFAWRLPLAQKIRGGQGKWLLRQVLYKHIPRELIDRPKMGFGIPLDDWLRGPLREWAEDLLAEDRLKRDGYLEPESIVRTWRTHQSGALSSGYRLWSVLMFQAWLDAQGRTA
jgi:asparagine synthase (glutamine-hydrolysing)